MSIYHRRAHVRVTGKSLDRTDIVVRLQEMRCIAVAEGVQGNKLPRRREGREETRYKREPINYSPFF